MAEYIEREALLELKEEMWQDRCDHMVVRVTNIMNAPTIDAVPVVHGRWDAKIMHDIGTYTVYWCSVCNCCSYFKHNYCPNCGAKMDLEI